MGKAEEVGRHIQLQRCGCNALVMIERARFLRHIAQKKRSRKLESECLVCSEEFNVAPDTLAGEILACSACGQEHELLMVDGSPKLGLAPEIEEDWGE